VFVGVKVSCVVYVDSNACHGRTSFSRNLELYLIVTYEFKMISEVASLQATHSSHFNRTNAHDQPIHETDLTSQVRGSTSPAEEMAYIISKSDSCGVVVQDAATLERMLPAITAPPASSDGNRNGASNGTHRGSGASSMVTIPCIALLPPLQDWAFSWGTWSGAVLVPRRVERSLFELPLGEFQLLTQPHSIVPGIALTFAGVACPMRCFFCPR